MSFYDKVRDEEGRGRKRKPEMKGSADHVVDHAISVEDAWPPVEPVRLPAAGWPAGLGARLRCWRAGCREAGQLQETW